MTELPDWALPAEGELTAMVRQQVGRARAEVVNWWIEEVAYDIGTPTTARLARVRGIAKDDGDPLVWSFFVKELQSFRHWPPYEQFAPLMREIEKFDARWRFEADVYESDLYRSLPPGFRLPKLYAACEGPDLRLALWLEDVATVDVPWDLRRFERAAHLLGRLSARLTRGELLPASASLEPGEITRLYVTTRLHSGVLDSLRDDALWAHPLMAQADDDLRTDLERLAARIPEMLDALDKLPQTYMHGDASPQNLLVPAADPDGFVVIDWSMAGLVAVGYDLAQLLVGLAHDGQLSVDELPAVYDAIAVAHTEGLAREGMPVDVAAVKYGFDAALVIRSAFTALPIDRIAEPPTEDLADHVAERLALTRYLVDLGLRMPRADG